jgi:formylglycine-generating enzyme
MNGKYILILGSALCLLLAIAGCTKKTTEITYITPSDWQKVEGGTFNNGTSDVTVSTFYLNKYEVTQAEYQALTGDNPSGFPDVANGPVERVSWLKSIGYCNLKSINDGLAPCYSYGMYGTNPADWPAGWNTGMENHLNVVCNWSAKGYRLPTEAEWEFAAQGGSQTHDYTYSGSDYIAAVAWYSTNSDATVHTVGTRAANELGVFDMSGNAWEWCWDIWATTYPTGAQTNPHGATSGTTRVTRGGAYNAGNAACEVVHRSSTNPASSIYGQGIRLCRKSL